MISVAMFCALKKRLPMSKGGKNAPCLHLGSDHLSGALPVSLTRNNERPLIAKLAIRSGP